jgi:hypothetical protein
MKNISPSLRTMRILSLATLFIGLMLITFMITVEGELGALPLALTLGGGIWAIIVNYQIKSKSKS